MSVGSLETTVEKIINNLSAEEKDILRAALIVGWSLNSFKDKNSIVNQILDSTKKNLDALLQKLMNFTPPLVDRGPNGQNYRFTKIGSIVAKEIFSQPASFPFLTKKPLRIINPYPSPGEIDKAMKEYASNTGIKYVKLDPTRCSFCHHKNRMFLKKGDTLLCPECFKRGTRL
jgi:hypothetical protein